MSADQIREAAKALRSRSAEAEAVAALLDAVNDRTNAILEPELLDRGTAAIRIHRRATEAATAILRGQS